jgi:hypothetical protein
MVGFVANIEPMASVDVTGYDPALWPKRSHRQMLQATTSVLVTTSFSERIHTNDETPRQRRTDVPGDWKRQKAEAWTRASDLLINRVQVTTIGDYDE